MQMIDTFGRNARTNGTCHRMHPVNPDKRTICDKEIDNTDSTS